MVKRLKRLGRVRPVQQIKKTKERVVDEVVKGRQNAMNAIRAEGSDVVTDVAHGGKDVSDKVREAGQEISEGVREGGREVAGQTKDSLKDAGAGFVDVFKNVADAPPSYILSGLGDSFFPSNTKLRQRAMHLESDCRHFMTRFNQESDLYHSLDSLLGSQLDGYLKVHGFDSVGDLDVRVMETADSRALQDWESLKRTINVSNAVDRAIYVLSGVLEVGGIAAIGTLVQMGVVSGPAGWAALGGLGSAVAVVGVATIIGSVITGKVMQEKLKDCVEDLFHARADTHLQWQRLAVMNTIMKFMISYVQYLVQEVKTSDPTAMMSSLQANDRFTNRWSIEGTHKALRKLDKIRQSWTKEDPEPRDELLVLVEKQDLRTLWKGNHPKLPPIGRGRVAKGAGKAIMGIEKGVDNMLRGFW